MRRPDRAMTHPVRMPAPDGFIDADWVRRE